MNRRTAKKSILKSRRLSRLRKLKTAALSVGLATAWGGVADAGTLFSATATATITLAASRSVGSTSTATVTITVEGLDQSAGGGSSSSSALIDQTLQINGDSGYYYVGVSGDDLVLSFPNGGAGVIGEFWGSLFLRNGQGVTEGQILDQLANTPLQNGALLDPSSPLGQLDKEYGGLLRTPFGEESTLVAFRFLDAQNPNNGVDGGRYSLSVVPEPASLAMLAAATGVSFLGARRRD